MSPLFSLKKISIFHKIIISSVLLVLIPITGLTGYHFLHERSYAALDEIERLKVSSMSLASEVDDYLSGRLNVVEHLAADSLFIELTASHPTVLPGMAVNRSLENHLAVSRDYAALYVLDRKGTCIASTDSSFLGKNYRIRTYFREALKGHSFISDWSIGLTSGKPGIYFSSPIRQEKGIQAVMVLKLEVDKISQIISEKPNSFLSTFLVNRAGIILEHSNFDLIYRSLVELSSSDKETTGVSKQFAGRNISALGYSSLKRAHEDALHNNTTVTTTYTFEDEDRIAALSRVKSQDWTIGISKPFKNVYANSYTILMSALGIALLSLLVTVGSSILITKELTQPIDSLLESMARFAGGDKAARAPIDTWDEIGELSGSFNDMAEVIHTHTQELEQKVQERTQALESAYEEIKLLSIVDPLTGCYNRRYLQENLEKEIARARRYNTALSIILCDIDHFKAVNDTYGHLAGDLVIKEFARLILEMIRKDIDWVCRYGGEEFLLVVPNGDISDGEILAERIRTTVEEHQVPWQESTIKITSSFGVSAFPSAGNMADLPVSTFIDRADSLLYAAKNKGRNRVEAQEFPDILNSLVA